MMLYLAAIVDMRVARCAHGSARTSWWSRRGRRARSDGVAGGLRTAQHAGVHAQRRRPRGRRRAARSARRSAARRRRRGADAGAPARARTGAGCRGQRLVEPVAARRRARPGCGSAPRPRAPAAPADSTWSTPRRARGRTVAAAPRRRRAQRAGVEIVVGVAPVWSSSGSGHIAPVASGSSSRRPRRVVSSSIRSPRSRRASRRPPRRRRCGSRRRARATRR